MEALIEQAWSLYRGSHDLPCVVRPSMPILYFGDHERYRQSPLKVITVGLNPSKTEFPNGDQFRRFRIAEHLYPAILQGDSYRQYVEALNDYFRNDPYMSWFGTFERLLDGIEASFLDGRTNTALHTDLCSPLATDPTWSKLAFERDVLGRGGVSLWLDLARHLAPDVVLISVAWKYLEALDPFAASEWETIYLIERTNPYEVKAREIEIAPGKRTALVFGRAHQKPFAAIKGQTKFEIGRRVAEWVNLRRSP